MSGVKVVIVGAGGLVGNRLCRSIQKMDSIHVSPTEELPLTKIALFDKFPMTHLEPAVVEDSRVSQTQGDLCDKETMTELFAPEGCARVTVIHLAALLSGYSEDKFDEGMKINLFGTINCIECARALKEELGGPQIYMYCSTDYAACFNEYNRTHPVTEEAFRLSPCSYGVQKACNELLLSDYTRKGFVDARVCRLSAVIGRPGWSNSISYPYTGIFTQPLEGKDYKVPLPMDINYPCSALNNNVASIIHMVSKVDGTAIGHNRVVQMPCRSYTLKMIHEATIEVAAEEQITLGKVEQGSASDGSTTVSEIDVCPHVSCEKAVKLGCPNDVVLKEIIRDYVNTYIKK